MTAQYNPRIQTALRNSFNAKVPIVKWHDKANPRGPFDYDVELMCNSVISKGIEIVTPPMCCLPNEEMCAKWGLTYTTEEQIDRNDFNFDVVGEVGHRRVEACKRLVAKPEVYGLKPEDVEHLKYLEMRVVRGLNEKELRDLAYDEGDHRSLSNLSKWYELQRRILELENFDEIALIMAMSLCLSGFIPTKGKSHALAIQEAEGDFEAQLEASRKAIVNVHKWAGYVRDLSKPNGHWIGDQVEVHISKSLDSRRIGDIKQLFKADSTNTGKLRTSWLKTKKEEGWKPITNAGWKKEERDDGSIIETPFVDGGNPTFNKVLKDLIVDYRNPGTKKQSFSKETKSNACELAISENGEAWAVYLGDKVDNESLGKELCKREEAALQRELFNRVLTESTPHVLLRDLVSVKDCEKEETIKTTVENGPSDEVTLNYVRSRPDLMKALFPAKTAKK